MNSRLCFQSRYGGWRSDEGLAHGQGFQEFVLNAASDSQRRHHNGRTSIVRTYIGHRADDFDAGTGGQTTNGRHRPAAYDRKTRLSVPTMNFRPDLPAEPTNPIHVWPIIQGPDENATRLRLIPGVEIVQIDSIRDHFNSAAMSELTINVRLGIAYQSNGSGTDGQFAFQSTKSVAFQAVQPGFGRAA